MQNENTLVRLHFEFSEVPAFASIDFGVAHHTATEHSSFRFFGGSADYRIGALCFRRQHCFTQTQSVTDGSDSSMLAHVRSINRIAGGSDEATGLNRDGPQ